MQLKNIPLQRTLQYLGYKEEKVGYTFNWKKPINGKDFPRFHIVIENEKASIHIDDSRFHGFFNKWIRNSKENNISNGDKRIYIEISKLDSYDTYFRVIEERIKIDAHIDRMKHILKIK